MARKIAIKQDPEKEVPMEVLADAVVAITEGVKKLLSSRVTDRTLYMLIADAAPQYGKYPKSSVGVREVKAVLEGITQLEARHLKKKPLR